VSVGVAENKRTFARFWSATKREDRLACVTDDLVWWVPKGAVTLAGEHRGAELVVDTMIEMSSKAFAGAPRFEVAHLVAEGDVVIAEVNIRAATPVGEYDNWYVFVAEFRDGKIAALREHVDTRYAAELFSSLS
jgi:ketosteroid isomerase-like protein